MSLADRWPVVLLSALSGTAWAKEPVDPGAPRAEVVQDRRFGQSHEIAGWFGVLPMDAFTKGVTLTAGYTWHPTSLWGWEVAQVTGSFGIDTRLADELAALPQPVGPTPFETVQLYGTSNVVFKPIYGKLAVMNRQVVWCEVFLVSKAWVLSLGEGLQVELAPAGVDVLVLAPGPTLTVTSRFTRPPGPPSRRGGPG